MSVTPVSLSQAMSEAYAYADPAQTFYDTLTFTASTDTEQVRVVNSDRELVTPQGVYLPCAFELRLPDTEGEIVGALEVEVRFLPRQARRWVQAASRAGAVLTVMWRQYLAPGQAPDAEYPVPLTITSVEHTPSGVTVTATFPDLVNAPFPRRLMLAQDLPGAVT